MTDPYELWKSLGRPGGDFGGWQASQGGGAAPQVTGGSVAPPAATPGAPLSLEQMIRQGAQGQSEDFARFNSGTVQGWGQQYYDAAASQAAGRPQFRSIYCGLAFRAATDDARQYAGRSGSSPSAQV